jgi:RNase H-like domain found in reverse transcriptase
VDLETHKVHLAIVLQILKDSSLFAKENKCEFELLEIEYLGHLISSKGVSTDPKKIEAMVSWQIPKNVKELRGFLSLTGYYRIFVKGYGTISKPLTQLLKNDSFQWSEEAEVAFHELKQDMCTAPVLAMPDFHPPFVLETNVNANGIGAVLMQGGKVIAYFSKALGVKSQALSTYEKELLALVTAVQKWQHYFQGNSFVIKTDNLSLKYLLEQRLTILSQYKILYKLMGMDYSIQYKKGCENLMADALSRKVEVSQEGVRLWPLLSSFPPG